MNMTAEDCLRIIGEHAGSSRLVLVGGAVRDKVLGKPMPGDLDIIVLNGSSKSLSKHIVTVLPGSRLVKLDEDWGIYRVVLPETGITIDFSDALENNLDIDLGRRDLTINAIGIDLATSETLDPLGGLKDLRNRHIRMISEKNILDDPLRLLRVFRFGAAMDAGSYGSETLDCVRMHREKVWQAAPERIQYELFKLFNAERCFPALETMAETGLLEAIFPELKETRKVPANGYHHLGLFEHTLELVNQSEQLIRELSANAQEIIRAPFNGVVSRFGLIKLACLLHDIGKPATMAVKAGTDRLTYYGHDRVSEEMTDEIAKRLKLSNEVTGYVKKLVRWHLYPCHFSPQSSRKSVLKFLRRMGDEAPDVILLALADRHSTLGPEKTGEVLVREHNDHIWLLNRYFEEQNVLKLPPLLTGHDVMAILKIKPGPEIREVLTALEEAQQLGDITTPEAARQWIADQFGVSSSRTTSP